MRVDQRVEYQTGIGSGGFGTVIAVNEAAGEITVCDEEDGSLWTGSIDYAVLSE